jgi:hypothetical protein
LGNVITAHDCPSQASNDPYANKKQKRALNDQRILTRTNELRGKSKRQKLGGRNTGRLGKGRWGCAGGIVIVRYTRGPSRTNQIRMTLARDRPILLHERGRPTVICEISITEDLVCGWQIDGRTENAETTATRLHHENS